MPVPDPRAFGLVELDAEGRLTRFREKPTADEPITTNTINAGIYLIDAALLDRIPTDRPVSIEREFFPALITDGIPCLRLDAARRTGGTSVARPRTAKPRSTC